MRAAFGHIDLRVSDLTEAQSFYDALLPALGFTDRYHGDLAAILTKRKLDASIRQKWGMAATASS